MNAHYILRAGSHVLNMDGRREIRKRISSLSEEANEKATTRVVAFLSFFRRESAQIRGKEVFSSIIFS
jgi:ferritin